MELFFASIIERPSRSSSTGFMGILLVVSIVAGPSSFSAAPHFGKSIIPRLLQPRLKVFSPATI